jgi:hypothetical protein
MAGHRESSSPQSTKDEDARLRSRRRLAKAIALTFCLALLLSIPIYMTVMLNPGPPPTTAPPPITRPPPAEPSEGTDQTEGGAGAAPPPASAPPRTTAPPPTAPSPTTAPAPSPSPTNPDQELDAFISSCELGRFRKAQVDYPRTLTVRLGGATTYGAAVDIRDTPAPPDKVIDAADPTSADDVKVECAVAAKLVSVGGGISVDAADTPDDGWRYLVFPPSGVLEWSWSVTPREPVSQQLRLELKPTAKIDDRYDRNKRGTAVYVTTVNVTATPIDRLAYWFQTQWGPLTAVAGSIGVAILAILAFSNKARDAAKRLFTKHPRKEGDTQSSDRSLDFDEEAQHEDKTTDKRSQRTDGGEN